jgi:hypothetical protein
MHKNTGVKAKQSDDGIGNALVSALEVPGNAGKTHLNFVGVSNFELPSIRRGFSEGAGVFRPLKSGYALCAFRHGTEAQHLCIYFRSLKAPPSV